LQELPCTFAALSCLKLLFLGHNQLAALPSNLTRLFLLSTLDVSYNKLQYLPQDLHQLQSLAKLNVQDNQLVLLPQGLSRLTGLESLAVGHNQGLQLPQGSLAGLRGLTCLMLAGVGLTDASLDAAVQQDPPSGITAVVAAAAAAAVGGAASAGTSVTNAASGPGDVGAAAAAAAAMVVHAPVAVLPSLRVLDVSHNQLQLLPQWLPPSLCCLCAAGNRIREVSGDMFVGLAGSLLQLDLQDNVLHDVPAQLRLLTRLQVLALQGNPGLDPELADKGMGLAWAFKWLATRKTSAVSAAQKAAAVAVQPRAQQQAFSG
jgi:Leucine-rich repeat (LRR) protein